MSKHLPSASDLSERDLDERFCLLMDQAEMFDKLSGKLMRHYVSDHETSNDALDALADGEHRGAADCAKCAQLVSLMDEGAMSPDDAEWLSSALA